MQLFHEIPDAIAIIRTKGGVYKQAKVYHRDGRVFVAASGGFVRVYRKFGETWGTTAPGLTVVEISQDCPGLWTIEEPRYTPAPAIAGKPRLIGTA